MTFVIIADAAGLLMDVSRWKNCAVFPRAPTIVLAC
jgi:hypothetical protein